MTSTPQVPGTAASLKRVNYKLAFASLGVVFGDIGTSPLYAMREALHHVIRVAPGADLRASVLSVVSLLIWALILIVTIKYVILLMRADNKGEGGILSLVVLVQNHLRRKGGLLLALGLVGAAFFFGDAMITPAISVLSAVEGLKVINPRFEPFVVPLTLVVLFTLFLMQYRGTAGVAALFAPITTVWFVVIAAMGLIHIGDDPQIFLAFNPYYGARLLFEQPVLALLVLGGVFLAVTGGEALYADMGHFGRTPIRMGWSMVVLPALILNYLGQGAFINAHPDAVSNPFYLMAPSWGLIPLVLLATMVTVIASQAVITGAFSIAQQAISLGLLPRMNITHTSESEQGQIYISQINWLLLFGVLLLVLIFRSSTNLAAAYGVAVNVSMIIDSILALVFFWKARNLPPAIVLPLLALVLVVESAFFASNALKLPHADVDARPRSTLGEAPQGLRRASRPSRESRAPRPDARCRRCRIHGD
jgi:KUP system potassium uptake protein